MKERDRRVHEGWVETHGAEVRMSESLGYGQSIYCSQANLHCPIARLLYDFEKAARRHVIRLKVALHFQSDRIALDALRWIDDAGPITTTCLSKNEVRRCRELASALWERFGSGADRDPYTMGSEGRYRHRLVETIRKFLLPSFQKYHAYWKAMGFISPVSTDTMTFTWPTFQHYRNPMKKSRWEIRQNELNFPRAADLHTSNATRSLLTQRLVVWPPRVKPVLSTEPEMHGYESKPISHVWYGGAQRWGH